MTFNIFCADQNDITDHMKTKRNKSDEVSTYTSKATI